MQHLRTLLAGLLTTALLSISTLAFSDQYVRGYTRSDGTYVAPYTRSSPNNTVRDNFSYKGNSNPYTGETGSNYYRNSPSSEYYNGFGSTPRSQPRSGWNK